MSQAVFVGSLTQVVVTDVAPIHGAAPGQSRFDEHFGFAIACDIVISEIIIIAARVFIFYYITIPLTLVIKK